MKINFTSPSGPPPLPLTKYLTAYTDFSGNVIGLCSGSGAAGLTLAPLYNGWTNITGNAPAQSGYWKDSSGTVHLQGLVTGGLCDSAAITGSNIYKAVILILPPGYRPIYATALLLSLMPVRLPALPRWRLVRIIMGPKDSTLPGTILRETSPRVRLSSG